MLPDYPMFDAYLLHSVSYSGSWGQHALKLDEFVDKAAELGYGGVMLMAKRPHLSVLDYGSGECERLRERLERRGLKEVCIAGYCNLTADLSHTDVPTQEMQVQHIAELARMGRDLGARTVRIFTGYLEPAAPYQRQWDILVRCLREAADRAAACGVVLGVQNHHDLAVDADSLFDLIGEVGHPHCRAMFDAWAPALQGSDIVAAARRMGGITVHTTAANYQYRKQFRYNPAMVNYEATMPRVQAVPMAEGFIDYPAFFSALAEGGFRGTLAYEMCSPLLGGGSLDNLDRYARAFLDYRAKTPLGS